MTRTLTTLAAAAAAALAVSAAPASAGDVSHLGSRMYPPKPRGFIEIGTTETLDMYARGAAKGRGSAVKDGTSNTIAYAERGASFLIGL